MVDVEVFEAKPYNHANDPNRVTWLTDEQASYVRDRAMSKFVQSTGLSPDIYMCLIDRNFPTWCVE